MAKNITRLAYVEKITVANDDLFKVANFDDKFNNIRVKKIQMNVDKDCFLLINGCRIKVMSSLGLSIDYDDFMIDSLVVETSGVSVYAILGY